MHVKAQLNRYEKLEFAITIRAPVEEWRALLEQVHDLTKSGTGTCAWPLSGLNSCVRKMLEDLDKTHADVLVKEAVEQAP